jgi:hypothetical protein
MIGWVMRHPPAGSVLCLVLALGTLYHGLADAKAYRRFGKASPVAARIASLSKTAAFPPRWNAEVTWSSLGVSGSATLVVGPRGTTLNTPDLAVGTAVKILTAADNPSDAMLASRLTRPPVRLLGLEMHPAGLGFTLLGAVGAALLFVFRDKIRRDAP